MESKTVDTQCSCLARAGAARRARGPQRCACSHTPELAISPPVPRRARANHGHARARTHAHLLALSVCACGHALAVGTGAKSFTKSGRISSNIPPASAAAASAASAATTATTATASSGSSRRPHVAAAHHMGVAAHHTARVKPPTPPITLSSLLSCPLTPETQHTHNPTPATLSGRRQSSVASDASVAGRLSQVTSRHVHVASLRFFASLSRRVPSAGRTPARMHRGCGNAQAGSQS
jgi:hypothetical protein